MTGTRTPAAVSDSANLWRGILSVLPAIDAARVTVGHNTSTADLHRGAGTVFDGGRPVTDAARSAAFAAAVRNGYAALLDDRDPHGRQYLALTIHGRHALAETPTQTPPTSDRPEPHTMTAEQATPNPTATDDTATTYGMRDGFDYDRFNFSDAFPLPTDYVVAFGMAHFRGPDGHLWFAPDAGAALPGVIEWGHPQNVAEFDARNGGATSEAVAAMRDLCRVIDAAGVASARYQSAAY